MRTDLDHLPAAKQRELERVVEIIFEEFADCFSLATSEWKKQGRILKILLFGSYARGDWVDEPHTAKGYRSDYDLLIIVNDQRLTDRTRYWSKLEERLDVEFGLTKTLRTPVNFIIHSLSDVNTALCEGRYFFIDIAHDGIALYQNEPKDLVVPQPKTPQRSVVLAREYFEEWFDSAGSFYRGYRHAVNDGDLKKAVFDLHQATERYYHCVLIVGTFYSPHTHNISFLRTQAERLDQRLVEAWPRADRADRALFVRLREAYVKARYSRRYEIMDTELAWLGERVEALGAIVQAVCKDRIAELEQALALSLSEEPAAE